MPKEPNSKTKIGAPPYVGALLRLSLTKVRRRLLEAVAKNGYRDISASHLVAFSYPFPDGVKPTELAQRANQSKQSLNHMLCELEAGRYLVRRADKPGGRRRVHLSAKGKAVVAVCQSEMRALEKEWSERVGKARFATFMDVLKNMPDHVD